MTKREHLPIDYDSTPDLRQRPTLGCLRSLMSGVGLLAALGFIAFGIYLALPKPKSAETVIPTLAALPSLTSTATSYASLMPTATNTPDAWGATGTALANATVSPTPTASATLDYCYWLTPTSTPSPTAANTPDAWGATGTAVYAATNPPQSPTPEPPRELCVERPQVTATWTPFPFPQLSGFGGLSGLSTLAASATATRAPITWTPSPVPQQSNSGAAPAPAGPPVVVTSPPVIVQVTSIVIQQQPIIITATRRPPTLTPSATITSTPKITLSPTQTETPTATPTVTRDAAWFASATAYYGVLTQNALQPTATDVPTLGAPTEPSVTDESTREPTLELPSATPTEMATLTETPTPTNDPTVTPTDVPTLELPTDMPTVELLPTDEVSS